jgi:hypothetical protein
VKLGANRCKTVLAHRFALMCRGIEIHEGAVVMHTCDVRNCVNPAHLRVGTQRENLHDMAQKGRAAVEEKHPAAKLNRSQVAQIKSLLASGHSQRAIARQFGRGKHTIQAIKEGRSWRSVGA